MKTIRVLDFDGEISNQEGLSKKLSHLRRKELKKLHQGKEKSRWNEAEELDIVRTSDRDGKFKNQDCWNRDIVERLICNAIIAVRFNITETNAMKDSRM